MAIYKAGIYDWADQEKSLDDIMKPLPPPVFTIPGMHVGCIPFSAILSSTLECFFSDVCLNETIPRISSIDPDLWPHPMIEARLSKFKSIDTVERILQEYFVDRWEMITSYRDYFDGCNPISCSFSYSDYDNIIHIIAQIISFYGGLTVILRFTIPFLAQTARATGKFFSSKISNKQTQRSVSGTVSDQ